MKVSELTGALLDYWVAKAEGKPARLVMQEQSEHRYVGDGQCWTPDYRGIDDGNVFAPSIRWEHGGSIIEREGIAILPMRLGEGWRPQTWVAHYRNVGRIDRQHAEATTPLVAAMRCFVASKFGDEVSDIPEKSE